MTTTDLTPTLREALTKVINADKHHNFLSAEEFDALIDLRNDCPERPALEGGVYEVPDRYGSLLRYVRDGRYSRGLNPDGTLYDSHPLPDDVSTWRRIDGPPTVAPEQLEEAALVVSGYSKSRWATLGGETRDFHRDRARNILASAGVEVSDR